MIQFHEFYGKPTTQQINSFIKGMSHLISVKDAAEYIRKHFNLKKVKLNSTGTRVMAFEEKDMSHCNCNAPKGFSCKAHCKEKKVRLPEQVEKIRVKKLNQRNTEVQREGFQTIHNRRERDEGW